MQAAPGQWVVYGLGSVESARAHLAEAQAQMKMAQAAFSAAFNKASVSSAKVNNDRVQREGLSRQHAAQEAFHDADRVIKADQAQADADQAAANQANDRMHAAEAAQVAAATALDRARHPVVWPVLTRGEIHQWDDFKVMSPVVIKDGGRYRMWYVGCHFIEEEYTCGIGHAQSRDGITWEKSPGPVLAIEDPVVSQNLHSIAVVHAGDQYLLWYAIDQNLLHGDDCATLHLATSRDGLAWKPQGLVLSANCQNTAHLWQSTFYDGKTIHLWYADYDSSANGSLVHLVSLDGKNWRSAGAPCTSTATSCVSSDGKNWHQEASTDIGGLGMDPRRLWVLPHPPGYRALFAARHQNGYFGMLQSSDGSSWNIAGDAWNFVELNKRGGFPLFSSGDDGEPEAPTAIVESGGTWMWFAVPNTRDGSEEIALAFQKEAQQ